MLYSELETIITDTIQSDDEESFEDHIPDFVRMAEASIMRLAQLGVMSKTATTPCNVASEFITLPTDYIAPLHISVIDGDEHRLLIQKDMSWLLAAYPSTASADYDLPRYYAVDDENSIRLRPIPDDDYTVWFEYSHKPESLVDVDSDETTWISDNMRPALVYGSLMHAALYIADYTRAEAFEKQFMNELGVTKVEQEGRARTERRRKEYRRPEV